MTTSPNANQRTPRVIAAMAVVAACACLSGSDARAQTASESSPVPMPVTIDSRPRGATVRVDDSAGTPLGVTPLRRVPLSPGWHNLFFSMPGYTTFEMRAQVAAGSTNFRVALTRSIAVRVTSNAGSALVVIDGNEVGYTPVEIDGLRAGRHVVEVRRDGMQPFRRTVVLRAGRTTVVAAMLEAATHGS